MTTEEHSQLVKELTQFQQLVKKTTQFSQYMTLEAAKVSDDGEIEATLLTFGEFNQIGNMFLKDAFDDFIAEKPTVPMYFQHSNTRYVGFWNDYRIDGDEMIGKGKLFVKETQEAKEKAALIRAGYLNRVSIGGESEPRDIMLVDRFDPVTKRFSYGLVYKKARLFEASLVLRPADTTAVIKQDIGEFFTKHFEQHDKGVSLPDILEFQFVPPEEKTDAPEQPTDVVTFTQDTFPKFYEGTSPLDTQAQQEQESVDINKILPPISA